MKRYYIACLLIFINITIFAQNTQPEINISSKIGITAGYHFFNIFNGNDVDTSCHYYDNYSASVFYLKDMTKIFSTGIEIENTAMKMNSEFSQITLWGSAALGHHDDYYYENLDYYINNLNFFILLHFNLISKNKFRFSLNIDPYFSYTIYSRTTGHIEKTEFNVVWDQTSGFYTVNEELKQYDIKESPIKNIEKVSLGAKLGYDLEFNISHNFSLLFVHNYYFIKHNTLNNNPSYLQSMKLSLGAIYNF